MLSALSDASVARPFFLNICATDFINGPPRMDAQGRRRPEAVTASFETLPEPLLLERRSDSRFLLCFSRFRVRGSMNASVAAAMTTSTPPPTPIVIRLRVRTSSVHCSQSPSKPTAHPGSHFAQSGPR